MDESPEEPDRKKRKTDAGCNGKTVIGFGYDGFVPRMDMLALIESCSKLRSRSMVDNLVTKASPDLTIDSDCLKRYPLERFDHFYKLIGSHVTTLTVAKVTELELQGLSSSFKNIRTLNLERIMILTVNLGVVFPNLVNLKLTECAIADETMSKILSAINSELRLHLNGSQLFGWLIHFPWDNGKIIAPAEHLLPRPRKTDDAPNSNFQNYPSIFSRPLSEFPHTLHLTLERYSLAIGLSDTTESLRIVNCGKRGTMNVMKEFKYDNGAYSQLKCLSLETRASALDFVANISKLGVGDSLESLTLSHLPTPTDWLRGLKTLRQLRILLPIQTYQQVALTEALSAMKDEINVEYCGDVSPEPQVDQILNILNDDCLREIVSFLTLEDIFNLAMTHSRFKELITTIDVGLMDVSGSIDKEFLSRHPPNMQLIGYEAIGHSMSTLLLRRLEGGFTPLLPCFSNLLHLNFSYSDVKWTVQAIKEFPAVESLVFDYDETAKDMFTSLIRKVQPTLKALYVHFEPADFQFLTCLRDLKELGISRTILDKNMNNFWKQNHSLEVLAFENYDGSDDYSPQFNRRHQERNWMEIASLQHLSVLDVEGYNFEFAEPLPMLKQVRELTLDGLDERMYQAFLNCTGSRLELLSLPYQSLPPNEIIALISDLKSLRNFEYRAKSDASSVEHVIQWLSALPLLDVILMQAPMEFYVDFEKIISFLAASNRVLYFNGVKYPQ